MQILSLSGIGDYTASAISSIAFGERAAVLDGNVARVLARLGAIRGDLRGTKKWQALQKEADRLLAPDAPDHMRHWLAKGLTGIRLFTFGSTMSEQANWLDDPKSYPAVAG